MQKDRLKQILKEKGKLKPVSPSEQEMKEFFEDQQGQFGSRPATVSFRQVVIAPHPTDAAKSAGPGPRRFHPHRAAEGR